MNDLKRINRLLSSLGFPENFNNDLTAWTVLALSDEEECQTKAGFLSLANGSSIRDILDYCRKNGKNYAENTRESIRKHSVKYLVDFGLAIRNHDDPARATNSSKTNYILTSDFRTLLKNPNNKKLFDTLKKSTVNDSNNWRTDKSLVVNFDKFQFNIHPSKHNIMEKAAIDIFLPHLEQEFEVIYFSETDDKSLYVSDKIKKLIDGEFDVHKKVPDVVAITKNNTIYFIESVASSGEINSLRKKEIDKLFSNCSSFNKKYINVFFNRKDFRSFSNHVIPNSQAWILDPNPEIVTFESLLN